METVGDWRRWFRRKGVRPTHARRWVYEDEETVSGAFRTDDGRVWGWLTQGGKTEVHPADSDRDWDQPHMVDDTMTEATGEDCVRILEAPPPWESGDPERAARRRVDDNLRGVFG